MSTVLSGHDTHPLSQTATVYVTDDAAWVTIKTTTLMAGVDLFLLNRELRDLGYAIDESDEGEEVDDLTEFMLIEKEW